MKLKLRLEWIQLFMITLFSLGIASCDPYDCIIPSGPELPTKKNVIVGANKSFSMEIKAEVKNTTFDDSYEYIFSVGGNFPKTLEYRKEGIRKLVISGFIQNQGEHTFEVYLTVRDLNATAGDPILGDETSPFIREDGDDLCFKDTSESYTIEVVKNLKE